MVAGAVVVLVGCSTTQQPADVTTDSSAAVRPLTTAPELPSKPALPTTARTPTSSAASSPAPDPSNSEPIRPPPSTTAGLARGTAPAPARLGTGWAFEAPRTSPEDGIIANGGAALARDPADVIAALSLFGCPALPAPKALPRPLGALEVHYRHHSGTPGVVLLLEYAKESAAVRAVDTYLGNARACSGGRLSGLGPGDHGIVERLAPTPARGAVLEHRESGENSAWLEAVGRTGSTVTLLSISSVEASVVTMSALAAAVA